jgi:hypothetical protein
METFPMPNATVRANARALPEEAERSPQPAQAEFQVLAADFEVALEALRPFFYGSGSDDDADAATARVDEIARKIVAIPTTDIEMMRLKARVYLWSEGENFKTFAAQNENDGSSDAVLVSLFRDLGADRAPDADLIALAHRCIAANERLGVAADAYARAEFASPHNEAEEAEADRAQTAAVADLRELVLPLARMQPSTFDGLLAKAKAMGFAIPDSDVRAKIIEEALAEDPFDPESMSLVLARDLIVLAGEARS